MLDRANACPLLICSPQGGMGIEEIEEELILKMQINPLAGMTSENIREATSFMKFNDSKLDKQFEGILANLYNCFLEKSCTLVEINPLGLT